MSIKNKIPLSRAQREVMEIIWDKGEANVQDVTQVLNQQRSVARTTVRTLMERIEEKGWLTHYTEGRSYVYSPIVPREESLGQRVLDIVDKACGGNPEKLLVALLQYRGLSDDETTRIRKILDDNRTKETQSSK